jgi:hypothetical protein
MKIRIQNLVVALAMFNLIYEAQAASWATSGPMIADRFFFTATLLPNGQVLVAGGLDQSDNTLKTAELYDPATGKWTETSSLNIARSVHTATMLPTGQVLIAGGGTTVRSPARSCTIPSAGRGS